LLDFSLDGSSGCPRSLEFVDDMGVIFVHKVVHEIEVDNFPGEDVEGARDQGNANAYTEGFAKADGASADIVAVRADAEIDE